jgi:uncharacterized protein (TIGR03382 family)
MKRCALLLFLCGFHQPASFEASVNDGGGNRVYFDGSPRQKNYDCTACHTGATGAIAAKVDFTPAVGGAYTPGTTYTITVSLVGEHLGFGTANNQNGFVAEFVDDMHAIAGIVATPDVSKVLTIDDGNVIAGEGKDITTWTFAWAAPAAGRGAATLHLGMVDGNGANSQAVPQNDPGGDDVAIVQARLCEGAVGCNEPAAPPITESKAAGCNASGAASPLLVVLALVLLRRRRTLLACALAGCFSPNVPQDCPDHVCGTTGGPDGGSCLENWVCSSWEAPANSDQATRTCTDLNNKGTTKCMPATTATLPALDLAFYQCNVHPIFQRGCGQLGCHGTDNGHAFRIYTRGRWRNDETVADRGSCLIPAGTPESLRMLGTGTVMCEGWYPHTATEWKKSFDSSRSFLLGASSPDAALILTEPTKGGLPHAQVKLFSGPSDPSYQMIRAWLGGARYGTSCALPGGN